MSLSCTKVFLLECWWYLNIPRSLSFGLRTAIVAHRLSGVDGGDEIFCRFSFFFSERGLNSLDNY